MQTRALAPALCLPIALGLVLSASLPARAADPVGRFAEGEVLVRWRDRASAARALASVRGALLHRHERLQLDRVKLPQGVSMEDALRRTRAAAGVEYAEPNWIIAKGALPDDARYGEQWALAAIAAPAAWDVRTDGSAVVVAIVDTGIRLDHPDLAGNLWTNAGEAPGNGLDDDGDGVADDVHGASFKDGLVTGDPMDDDVADSHGTHVAGTVGAVGDDGIGVAGVSWRARLMAVKVLHGSGGAGTIADAVAGIEYAVDRGASILNCSFSAIGDSAALADAFAFADAHGVLVVVAAGNYGVQLGTRGLADPLGTLVMPASIRTQTQLNVGATAADGAFTYYSDRSARAVDVAAPGGLLSGDPAAGILSTVYRCDDANLDGACDADPPTPGYGFLVGTSMAAPHVSGVAALVWSAHPELTHRQVKARILNGAAPLPALAGLVVTGGRVDAAASLSGALEGMPAVFGVSPYAAAAGGQVAIEGVDFGAAPGTVTVGGVALSVEAWSDESILATVPVGASSGPLQVNGEGATFPLDVAGTPPPPGALTLQLSAAPQQGVAPLEVTFTAVAVDEGSTVVKYEWDFGSGELREYAGVTTTAAFTYAEAGTRLARARVTDAAGRSATAEVSIVASAAPAPAASAAGGGDPRCFIATAAFGSPLEPHVRTLRAFRDRWLLASAPGRALVAAYYAASPPLAQLIRRHPALRAAARWALAPVVLAIVDPAAALGGALALAGALGLALEAGFALPRRRPRTGPGVGPRSTRAGDRGTPRAPS